jgi:undecaprenyl-diphosphatase
MLDYINRRDHTLMRLVHRWPAPRWIRLWMICATRGGDGWLWYALAAAIFLLGGAERYAALGASAVSTSLGILLFLWLKKWTGRKRPCAIEPHCWATLLPPDHFSFPSGHTIAAFAMVTPVCLVYPEMAAGLIFCAASVAVSRILLGMHFLSDVTAGMGIGAALGYFSYSLFF